MDKKGQLKPGRPKGQDLVLENTLLQALCPEAKLVEITVLGVDQMQAEAKDVLVSKLRALKIDGATYRIVGSSSSLKYGTAYYTTEPLRSELLKRFGNIPEYALAYFGILISPLYAIDHLSASVIVVPDHCLGTNDCRGWVARSVVRRLNLPPKFQDRAYQFRMAFGPFQAKGCLKLMDDEIATALDAEFVLPESAVKPGVEALHRDPELGIDAFRFRGTVDWGIREVSRRVPYKSNYTITQFASPSVLRREIIPFALSQINEIMQALDDGDYLTLLEKIGADYNENDEEDAPVERTVLEALLKADGSKTLGKHPWVQQQLRRLLAQWAYRVLTSGGFTMPARLLQDDGVLTIVDNRIVWASDWLPPGKYLADFPFKKGLLVRYPVYNFSQLLPGERLSLEEAVEELHKKLREYASLDKERVLDLLASQVLIPGAVTLHSTFAKQFQGDYDGDFCALIPSSQFPQFVELRNALAVEPPPEKNKTRKRSAAYNFEYVFIDSAGNQTGEVTNMNSEAIAAGRPDLAKVVGEQIQISIDAIKFNVHVDRKRLQEIKKEIPPGSASWITWKKSQTINDLPEFMAAPETDLIAYLWNQLRPEMADVFVPKSASEFIGLLGGEEITEDQLKEAKQLYSFYAKNMQISLEREQTLKQAYDTLRAQKAKTQKGSPEYRTVMEQVQRAKEALELYRVQALRDRKNVEQTVYKWSVKKAANRRAWAQVAWILSSRSRATGSFVFKTSFIPELVDLLIESTGGNPRLFEVPYPGDGPVVVDTDGHLFVEHPKSGRRIWVHSLKTKRKFPVECKAEIKDGLLVLPEALRPKTRVTVALGHAWPDNTPVSVSQDGAVKIPLAEGNGHLIPFKLPATFDLEFPAEIRDGKLALPYRIHPKRKKAD
jgi:hypothetical protein